MGSQNIWKYRSLKVIILLKRSIMIRIDKNNNGTYNIDINGYHYTVNAKTVKDSKVQPLQNFEYDCLVYELVKEIWKQNTAIRKSLIANKF